MDDGSDGGVCEVADGDGGVRVFTAALGADDGGGVGLLGEIRGEGCRDWFQGILGLRPNKSLKPTARLRALRRAAA